VAAHSAPPFRVSHIIFDVDGTLVDFVGALGPAMEVVAQRISTLTDTEVTPEAIQSARDAVLAEPEWRGRRLADVRIESFRRVLPAPVENRDAVAEELLALLVDARTRFMTVFPDVEETLRALKAKGLVLAAGSNGNMDLGAVGLAHFFVDVHHAEAIGFSKPDPRFFEHIAQVSGATPAATLAIGDRLDNDYEPARAAGMHAVLLDRAGRVNEDGVTRVDQLTQLVDLVEVV
jgi:putative hydrolase of the HAD superfamily